ncbi:mannan endo-1,4-beta-mannosidase 7-like [Silene latifolia]|uniref:mannan endo-1,4-beta-mannosidase 7-like n=1 Tax=Silene latifolia TaxID=37657 RepID=UPI003D775276
MKNYKIIFLIFLLTILRKAPLNKGDEDGFISKNGVNFILNGEIFYGNGFNAYWLMCEASNPYSRQKVSSALQEASSYGLTIARTWAFNDGGYNPLQYFPGSYNEQMFQGLDFVISEANKYGIKLILSLVNSWDDYGGRKQYLAWANLTTTDHEDDFYINPTVKDFYKRHVKTVLTRVNSITKVAYKDDPTIMAWELMNEPRCKDLSGKTLQSWIGEMAWYVKSIDSTHLLEIGLEGFYGVSTPEKIQINPSSCQYGTDFIENNQISGIDFATVHSYPDNWLKNSSNDAQLTFLEQWVNQHIQDAQNIIQKPVLFTEFGKSYNVSGYKPIDRDWVYGVVYEEIFNSASNGGAAAGGLFWQLLGDGLDGLRDGYDVVLNDSDSLALIIFEESYKLSKVGK